MKKFIALMAISALFVPALMQPAFAQDHGPDRDRGGDHRGGPDNNRGPDNDRRGDNNRDDHRGPPPGATQNRSNVTVQQRTTVERHDNDNDRRDNRRNYN